MHPRGALFHNMFYDANISIFFYTPTIDIIFLFFYDFLTPFRIASGSSFLQYLFSICSVFVQYLFSDSLNKY